MSTKTSTDVIIAGKVYTLSGYESEGYLQTVASYINSKEAELTEVPGYRRFPAEQRATLLELNIADELFKAKQRAEKLEEDLSARTKELDAVTHELASLKAKVEMREQLLAEKEKENRSLDLAKARLETELADLKRNRK